MPGVEFAGTLIIPSLSMVTPVKPPSELIECVRSASFTATPFKVSLEVASPASPPKVSLIVTPEKSSSLATIAGALTTTTAVAVSQLEVFNFSHIW